MQHCITVIFEHTKVEILHMYLSILNALYQTYNLEISILKTINDYSAISFTIIKYITIIRIITSENIISIVKHNKNKFVITVLSATRKSPRVINLSLSTKSLMVRLNVIDLVRFSFNTLDSDDSQVVIFFKSAEYISNK